MGKPDSIDDDSLLMDYLPPDDMSRNGSDAQNLKEDYIFRKREIKLFKQTLEFINIIGDYPQGIDEKTRLSD